MFMTMRWFGPGRCRYDVKSVMRSVKRVLGLAFLLIICASCDNGAYTEGSFEERKAQILSRWNLARPRFTGSDCYEEAPLVTAPYSEGSLKSAYLADAENLFNFFRFLSGLPDVSIGNMETMYAQKAVVLLAAVDTLTHYPGRPDDMANDFFYDDGYRGTSSSNLGMGRQKLTDGLGDMMQDRGENNEKSVGHRRWTLSPRMKSVGFGQAQRLHIFLSVYVMDSRANFTDYQTICWPSGPAFPANFFPPGTVWSVSLNPEKYNTSAADLQGAHVTLTDHTRGEVSEFFSGCGKHFYINNGNYGVNNAIIFRPDYAIYPADGHYTVVITGLSPKGDNPATIQYSVRFFSLP